jgi:hypothetical protein
MEYTHLPPLRMRMHGSPFLRTLLDGEPVISEETTFGSYAHLVGTVARENASEQFGNWLEEIMIDLNCIDMSCGAQEPALKERLSRKEIDYLRREYAGLPNDGWGTRAYLWATTVIGSQSTPWHHLWMRGHWLDDLIKDVQRYHAKIHDEKVRLVRSSLPKPRGKLRLVSG